MERKRENRLNGEKRREQVKWRVKERIGWMESKGEKRLEGMTNTR